MSISDLIKLFFRGHFFSRALAATVPESFSGSKVVRVRLIPIVDGWQDGGQVFFDDVGLHRMK